MRHQAVIWTLLFLASALAAPPVKDDFVLTSSPPTTEPPLPVGSTPTPAPPIEPIQAPATPSTTTSEPTSASPLEPIEIYSMKVISEVSSRYAHTVVSSRVVNPANAAQEVTFSVLLPATAFISGFEMEMDGKVYKAYVKEKEDAKKIYQQALDSGIAAAHVTAKARDSNHFTVAVNVEANSKATLNLTYEELFIRKRGRYNDIINLNPGQIVKDLTVEVHIKENRPITVLKVPALRSGNEIDDEEDDKANDMATIHQSDDKKKATIRFSPTAEQQTKLRDIFRERLLAKKAKTDQNEYYYNPWNRREEEPQSEGLTGQFVVQYDVEHDPNNGEVLVFDGYFVHFFAPTDLKPLSKHVVFVLDVSGSMSGRKLTQLKEAMLAILGSLHIGDYISIIEFDTTCKVYDLDNPANSVVYGDEGYQGYRPWGVPEVKIEVKKGGPPPAPVPVTPEYIEKAKDVINKLQTKDLTNIDESLKTALKVVHAGVHNKPETASNDSKDVTDKPITPEPIIIFLTDGDATVGESNTDKIIKSLKELNSGENEAAIFCLGFGEDADRNLLEKISLLNNGFLRHIYEAADASLQLLQFYEEISSPLLAGVKFKYPADQVEEESVTKDKFHTLFLGGELIVAGKLKNTEIQDLRPVVSAYGVEGPIDFIPIVPNHVPVLPQPEVTKTHFEPAERLWAYLTIQQLTDKINSLIDVSKPEPIYSNYPGPTPIPDPSVSTTQEPPKISSTDSTATTENTEEEKEKLKKEALQLALKYGFVTPLTSLVVVKPNATSAVDAESADKIQGSGGFGGPPPGVLYSPAMAYPAPAPQFGPASYGSYGGGAVGLSAPMASFDFDGLIDTRFDEEPVQLSYMVEEDEALLLPLNLSGTSNLVKYGLDMYAWILQYFVEGPVDQLVIPINGTSVVLKLEADLTKLSADDPPCHTESGSLGVCKYITSCTSGHLILSDKDIYSKYYCSRDGYAGICCTDATKAV